MIPLVRALKHLCTYQSSSSNFVYTAAISTDPEIHLANMVPMRVALKGSGFMMVHFVHVAYSRSDCVQEATKVSLTTLVRV